jgi:catechol 2,3-dioxygenase-like lactoylglutathione lyase family enzyme
MASVSFAFTQLFVRDLELTTEFYSKVFGMREIQRMKHEGEDGMEEVVLACDDAPMPTLVLARFLDGRSSGEREVFLGFYSDDLDESVKNVISPPKPAPRTATSISSSIGARSEGFAWGSLR